MTRTVLGSLGLITFLCAIDLYADLAEGGSLSHVFIEGMVIGICLFVVVYFWRHKHIEHKRLVHELQYERNRWHGSSLHWQKQAQSHIQGLRSQIDDQFSGWQLTPAEIDVGYLLIKGFSIREIAQLRKVSEKTVRQQCQSIYRKSDTGSRYQFAAYFLEDLLSPSHHLQ